MVIERVSSLTMAKDVLYIGSAVPLETSEGLDAVQQPLRSRYPVENDGNIQGILSTLTILPAGIQLRYKSDPTNVVLFPFSALTMCAAVRCVSTRNAATSEVSSRFVSLSSPEAGGANSERPAIFTAITRRTKGRQVLECHGFITMTPKDALELVQWTSTMDKRSKQGGFHTLSGGMTSASSYDVSRGDTSFRAETASLPEFPIQLVPGEPMAANTSPAFYKEPPRTGYFYSTKNAHVKKYSLQKFSGSTGIDDTPSVIQPGADHFERVPHAQASHAGYAASHYSASAAFPPTHPRPTMMVPVRPVRPMGGPMGGPPPPFMRPVMIAPPYGYPRPRFFSPPPPPVVMRPRPIPIMVPPPHGPYYYDDEYPTLRSRTGRRGSRGSSRSSSGSSSSHSPRVNGKPPKKGRENDDSSGSSSRPRTPPTDYDAPRGHRVSRKDEYYIRQNYAREGHSLKKGARGPQGLYVVPTYGYYGGPPPPPGFERARSVPPYGENTGKKQKDKKSKKSKKDRKKSGKKHGHKDQYDESTDSVGYMSELGPNADSRQPRDFRRPENQFTHERAFSKSLAEEQRHSVRGNSMFNAYALNNTAPAGNEQDFPMY